jgi:hypothetical protein
MPDKTTINHIVQDLHKTIQMLLDVNNRLMAFVTEIKDNSLQLIEETEEKIDQVVDHLDER